MYVVYAHPCGGALYKEDKCMLIKTQETIKIANGPSKMDLVMSLAYAYDKHNTIIVHFVDQKGVTYPAIVRAISHEDGSGASFNINGSIDLYGPRCRHPVSAIKPTDIARMGCNFSGYYHAGSRTGALKVETLLADDK